MTAPLEQLQLALGHHFNDVELLRRALVHRSYLAEVESMERSFERLEFLGDAVLQLAVTDHLFAEYPDLPEGQMAKIRASAVDERTLASLARRFGVGDALRLGRGEEVSGGRDKPSILADAMEGIIGAVFLDGGWEKARKIVQEHWIPIVAERVREPGRRDYKTRLQELAQAEGWTLEYLIEGKGLDHARVFQASAVVNGAIAGVGQGTSKKRAEQEAARRALEEPG